MNPNNINDPTIVSQAVFPSTPNIAPNVVNTTPQNLNNKPAKPKHKILKITGVLFFIIAVVITAVFALTSAPVKVAKQQFSYIRQNDLQAAYDLFSDSAKNQYPYESFQTLVSRNHLSDAQTASISFSSREVNGDEAQLDGTIKVDDVSAKLRYVLIKVNGVWKISGFGIIPQ